MRAETVARVVYNRVPGCCGCRVAGIGGHTVSWFLTTGRLDVYVQDAGDGRVIADLSVVRGPGADRQIVSGGAEAVDLLVAALTEEVEGQ